MLRNLFITLLYQAIVCLVLGTHHMLAPHQRLRRLLEELESLECGHPELVLQWALSSPAGGLGSSGLE